MTRVSHMFAVLFFLNAILIASVTKPIALTLEGALAVLLDLALFYAAYLCGMRDGR